MKNGSERVVTNAREHLFDLRSLEHYQFVDEQGKDQGINSKSYIGLQLENTERNRFIFVAEGFVNVYFSSTSCERCY